MERDGNGFLSAKHMLYFLHSDWHNKKASTYSVEPVLLKAVIRHLLGSQKERFEVGRDPQDISTKPYLFQITRRSIQVLFVERSLFSS